ncbi:cyclin-dependent kinase inhibitor 3-like [Bidens hawaiensis]|uniref:cyclin-dependent kinase inhibitor 3-like n=1 Tax=Bidens hawaiensis TaxID=980011 RepID=UPI00404AB59B
MGKYFRKSKLTGDVVAVMDVSPSSLGVRTRAKTLALQKQLQASKTTDDDVSYLQLRSRKLEKPQQINCHLGSQQTSSSSSADNNNNNIEFDARERGTRESTPCSFIRESNDVITPGSSTRPTNRHASNRVTQRIMPSAQEIEEFFALHAQEQQRLFSEKYNFDIVNEKPLKGRYEWARVDM